MNNWLPTALTGAAFGALALGLWLKYRGLLTTQPPVGASLSEEAAAANNTLNQNLRERILSRIAAKQ